MPYLISKIKIMKFTNKNLKKKKKTRDTNIVWRMDGIGFLLSGIAVVALYSFKIP